MNLLKRPSCVPRCPNLLMFDLRLVGNTKISMCTNWCASPKIIEHHQKRSFPFRITIELLLNNYWTADDFGIVSPNSTKHLPSYTIIYHQSYSKFLPFKEWVQPPWTVGCCRSCRAMQRKGLGVPPDGGVGKSLLPKWSLHLIFWGWLSGVIENLVEFHGVLSLIRKEYLFDW